MRLQFHVLHPQHKMTIASALHCSCTAYCCLCLPKSMLYHEHALAGTTATSLPDICTWYWSFPYALNLPRSSNPVHPYFCVHAHAHTHACARYIAIQGHPGCDMHGIHTRMHGVCARYIANTSTPSTTTKAGTGCIWGCAGKTCSRGLQDSRVPAFQVYS